MTVLTATIYRTVNSGGTAVIIANGNIGLIYITKEEIRNKLVARRFLAYINGCPTAAAAEYVTGWESVLKTTGRTNDSGVDGDSGNTACHKRTVLIPNCSLSRFVNLGW